MNNEILILAGTAASIGFAHTVLGPDHYLPFIVIGRARQWTLPRTLFISFLCGLGHVLSSVVIGLVGIALGIAIFRLEGIETFRGSLAAWLLIGFGLAYSVWGGSPGFEEKTAPTSTCSCWGFGARTCTQPPEDRSCPCPREESKNEYNSLDPFHHLRVRSLRASYPSSDVSSSQTQHRGSHSGDPCFRDHHDCDHAGHHHSGSLGSEIGSIGASGEVFSCHSRGYDSYLWIECSVSGALIGNTGVC